MYETFEQLCQLKGVKPYKVSKDTGIPQPTLSDWKRGISIPKIDKLQKIADYFNVPLEFLQGKPPFDHWLEIEKDRRKFIQAGNFSPDVLHLIWGINPVAPYNTSISDFISFIRMAVISVSINGAGDWEIKANESYTKKEKAPAESNELTFDDFTYAMHNESKALTEEDKAILLSLAKQLREARKARDEK